MISLTRKLFFSLLISVAMFTFGCSGGSSSGGGDEDKKYTSAPVIEPDADEGAISLNQNIKISCVDAGASIYYSIDGENPVIGASNTKQYTDPFNPISTGYLVVKAIAKCSDKNVSNPASMVYTVRELRSAVPTITPVANVISSTAKISIESSASGASIYYTTNGSDPVVGNSVTTKYTGSFSLANGNYIIKAIAIESGKGASEVVYQTYEVKDLVKPVVSANPVPKTYSETQYVSLTSSNSSSDTIYYTTDGNIPDTNSDVYVNRIEVSKTMTIKAFAKRTDGFEGVTSTFEYIIEEIEIPQPDITPLSDRITIDDYVSISAEKGTIRYTIDDSNIGVNSPKYLSAFKLQEGTRVVRAIAENDGKISTVTVKEYVVTKSPEKVSTPVISTTATEPYDTSTVFTITCATLDSSIVYKLEGETYYKDYPDGGFTLPAGDNTIYAKATKSGMTDSDEASLAVTINSGGQVSAPLINILGDDLQVNTETKFEITCPTGGSSILYKIDSGSYNDYVSGGITVSEGIHTLSAIACKSGMNDSKVVSSVVEVIPSTVGLRIYYKTSSSDPTIWAWEDGSSGRPISANMGDTWPGRSMTAHSQYADWWYFDIPSNYNPLASTLKMKFEGSDPEVSNNISGKAFWFDGSEWHQECPDVNTKPSIKVDPQGAYYEDSLNIYVSFVSTADITSKQYRVDSGKWTDLPVGDTLRIGDGINDGESVNIEFSATNSYGETIVGPYKYTKGKQEVNADIDNLRIFQVMVCSFISGDGSIGYDWQWNSSYRSDGDIQGIIDSLAYIKSLGMNAIWLTPVFNTYSGDQAHNGYFANDYFNIDPHFGTNDKMQEFIDKAHEAGMYVFLDAVLGHNAGGNIARSPISGKTPSTSNPVNYNDGGNSLQFYKDVVYYWIKNYKVDGYRFDQSYQLGPGDDGDHKGQGSGNFYWDDIRSEIEKACQENKNAGETWGTLGYMVGEDWDGEKGIARDTYGTSSERGLHSAFDFPTRYRILRTLARQEDAMEITSNRAGSLAEGFNSHSVYPSHAHPNLMIGNHDLNRFGALVSASSSHNNNYWKRHKAALSIMAAYAGPITLYYGEEWGDGTGGVGSGTSYMHLSRTNGKTSGFSSDESDLIDYFTSIMQMRSEHPALWQEDTRTNLVASGDKYADLKYDSATGDKMVFVINLGTSNQTISFNVSSSSKLVDALDSSKVISGNGSYSVALAPLEARFFEVQ